MVGHHIWVTSDEEIIPIPGIKTYVYDRDGEPFDIDIQTITGSISNVNTSYTIPAGYHNGSGSVSIDSTEKAKLIAPNIKAGVTILGITGNYSGSGGGSGDGGIDTQYDTVTPDDLRAGCTAHDASGEAITGTLTSAALKPYRYDYNCGWVDNGTWKYENPTQTYIDIYEVVEGHDYLFTLGVNVGSRNRVMFTTTDITTVVGSNVAGTKIVNKNNPSALETFRYTPPSNGYILAAKDNVGKTGIKTYLYDTTTAWL